MEAVKKLQAEILAGPRSGGEIDMVANAKKVALFALGVAYQKYMTALEEQQEVVANITDILMNAFAMESVALRAEKIARSGKKARMRKKWSRCLCARRWIRLMRRAKTVLAACSEGDALRTNLAVLKRFTKYEPVNAIAFRRKIAARMIEAGKYTV